MKVALVHEALNTYGGAEKVLEELHTAFPDAPVFVPTYDPKAFPASYAGWDIRPSGMNRIPLVNRYPRHFFPLYPFAMNGMNLDDFDVVISSAFNFAHNVVTGPHTVHVSYCHSPPRFLWDFHSYAEQEGLSLSKKRLVKALLPLLRANDKAAAEGVNHWISTSRLVQDRIYNLYQKPSFIVPPPISVRDFWIAEQPSSYFLLLMRLVGWKKADIVVRACTELSLPLIVAGDGRELPRLKEMAGPTVKFVGRVDGDAKARLYAGCAAFILPSIEDFGITPLEAMASGRPVIALGMGGALDTIIPGRTGEFFEEQTVDCLKEALCRFRPDHYDPAAIRYHAEQYDSAHFRRRITALVEHCHIELRRRIQRPLEYDIELPGAFQDSKSLAPNMRAQHGMSSR